MEFDELQQIWDSQNNEPLYAMNAAALHNRILSKMKQARYRTNRSELLLILVNLSAAGVVLGLNLFPVSGNISMYGLAAWMFATALYVLVNRIRRIKADRRFDRSMYGDLDHAISIAAYQVRLSQIMRWNILPIGILVLLGAWEGDKLFWVTVLMLVSFAIAYYAGVREHNFYQARKRELETLQSKLGTKS